MPNEKNKGYEYMGFKMKGKAQRLLLTLAVSMAGIFCTACKNPIVEAGTGQEDEGEVTEFSQEDRLILWYTDEDLTPYLNSAALNYQKEKGIKVMPVLVSGVEYLEEINKASIHSESGPDLYITSNDNLEKAYLSGLAADIQDEDRICRKDDYPQTALDAVTYMKRKIAYPFYYETSFLLYNKTYMEDVLRARQENESGGEDLGIVIPSTIDDILNFADEYDAPETVEAVFKWDVSDIFYNYFFIGNYISVGGDAGDDPMNINLYNEFAIQCLKVYQQLNQFFSIDTNVVTYEGILEEFLEGKTVFTIATTDAVGRLDAAKEAGEFLFEYGVAVIPDINIDYKSRGLSVTNAVVINGYSEKQEKANDFAKYIAYDKAEDLYKRGGKIPARYGVAFENPEISKIMEEYEKSVSIPKMLETSNFWVQLEIVFTEVWKGEDVDTALFNMNEQITGQMDENQVENVKKGTSPLQNAGITQFFP